MLTIAVHACPKWTLFFCHVCARYTVDTMYLSNARFSIKVAAVCVCVCVFFFELSFCLGSLCDRNVRKVRPHFSLCSLSVQCCWARAQEVRDIRAAPSLSF